MVSIRANTNISIDSWSLKVSHTFYTNPMNSSRDIKNIIIQLGSHYIYQIINLSIWIIR